MAVFNTHHRGMRSLLRRAQVERELDAELQDS